MDMLLKDDREFHLFLADHLKNNPSGQVIIHDATCPSMDDHEAFVVENGACVGCGALYVPITDYLRQHAS